MNATITSNPVKVAIRSSGVFIYASLGLFVPDY